MGGFRALASALQGFVVFAFFCAGLFCIALPFLSETRFLLAEILVSECDVCFQIGLIFLGTSLLLLLGFYGANKGSTLYVEMGVHTVSIEKVVIRHSLEECFKRLFPQKIELSDVEIIFGKRLEIEVFLSSTDEKIVKEQLSAAEKHLQFLLRQRFGYTKPFCLILRSKL
jgi:hypothetical protein